MKKIWLYTETGLIVKTEFLHSLKSLIHGFSLKYPFKEFTAEGAEKRRGDNSKKARIVVKTDIKLKKQVIFLVSFLRFSPRPPR